jgi:nucleoside-diphosphate-sugar epimerase
MRSEGDGKRRVLVTGARGFIGRQALGPLQDRDFEVHAVSSRAAEHVRDGIRWHRADLLDPGAADALARQVRPSHLLHFAWHTEHGEYWDAPENDRWVQASTRLLEAFARHGGRRATLAGTCAEYDWGHAVAREDETPLAPSSRYAARKRDLHLAATSLARERGLSLAWGRIFFVFGPAEDPRRLVASVARALARREPAACSSGEQVRDFLHSEELGQAFGALLSSAVEGPVNVASGTGVSVRELVELLAEVAGRPGLLRMGALPSRPDDPPRLVADTTRLAEQVGWRPTLPLREALRRTYEWWRQAVD